MSYRPHARGGEPPPARSRSCVSTDRPHARGGEPELIDAVNARLGIVPTPVGVNLAGALMGARSASIVPTPVGVNPAAELRRKTAERIVPTPVGMIVSYIRTCPHFFSSSPTRGSILCSIDL